MKCSVFIASYAKDQEWLRWCLMSLKKFSVGFLPPTVGVTAKDLPLFRRIADEVFPEAAVVADGPSGWMAAQIRMMRADQYCPESDVIFLLGSDCLVIDEFRPDPFFHDGKPVMLYNTYDHLLKHAPGVAPWKKGTQRVLGFPTPVESMRQIPTVHPSELYPVMRAHVEALHKMPFDRYIHEGEKIGGGTSETNILGSYAWEKMHGIYHWVNLDNCYDTEMPKWRSPIAQFWSHGSPDAKCDRDIRYHGNKTTLGKTPRSVIKEILG